jgi:hypothetical protein
MIAVVLFLVLQRTFLCTAGLKAAVTDWCADQP